MLYSNLLLGTDYELKNRYVHVDYACKRNEAEFQSVKSNAPKVQIDTLECTLEEAVIRRKNTSSA